MFCFFSSYFRHLSDKPALALSYTHPENGKLSTINFQDVLHLVDGVTDGLVGHGAVLLGDGGALLPVDGGADLEMRLRIDKLQS